MRVVRVVRTAGAGRPGLFLIVAGERRSFYLATRIPSDIGGDGWEVWRFGTLSRYHLRIDLADPRNTTCDCIGFEAYRECRHVAGLTALLKAGRMAE